MWIKEAYLDVKKDNDRDADAYKSYDKKILDKVVNRAEALENAAKQIPKKDMRAIIQLETMVERRTELVEKFMLDFHKGLHSV